MTVARQAPLSLGFSGENTGVVAMRSFRGSPRPRDGTHISCVADRFFTTWVLGWLHHVGMTVENTGD